MARSNQRAALWRKAIEHISSVIEPIVGAPSNDRILHMIRRRRTLEIPAIPRL